MAKPSLADAPIARRPRPIRAPKNRYVRLDGVTLKKLSVYFPEELAIWLGMHAKQLECSVSELLTQLAQQYRDGADGRSTEER